MRVVFIGTVEFSKHCLQEVLQYDSESVVGVFTLPPAEDRYNSDYANLEPVAREYDVPLFHFQKISESEIVGQIRELKPDVIFVFGLSQIIPQEILDIPDLGCIGVHPTLLPKYRGRHPLIWPVIRGEERSGLTFFFMTDGVDDGDILWQEPFDIELEDDAGSLYEKIKDLASEAIPEFMSELESGEPTRIPQNEEQATYVRKRTREDGEIDWQESSLDVHNLIRAITRPYVGAHTFLDGDEIKIWKSQPLEDAGLETSADPQTSPGTVLSREDDALVVKTGDGAVRILEWDEPETGEISQGTRLG